MLLTCRHNNEEKYTEQDTPLNTPTPMDDSNEPEYEISRSLSGRIKDMLYAVMGNGYDLVAKPHTATWIILFFALVVYYTCFINHPGEK